MKWDDCQSRHGRLAALTGFYLPGRDKSDWLDTIGWIMALLTLAGTFIHAGLRIYSRNKLKKEQIK